MSQPNLLAELTGKVLLVDDSVENLKLLSALLSEHYKVKIAKDGEAALRLLDTDSEIRLVLLDIEMPGLDGYEVCQRIKANPKTKDIPVIFLTGRDDYESEVKGLALGGVDYITKPFKPEIILARVQSQWTIQSVKARADRLLESLLPSSVIDSLLSDGVYAPRNHAEASVLFFDLVGFTAASKELLPEVLVAELNAIFGEFDEIADRYAVQRIKTMGDGYIAVSGVDGNIKHHAARLAASAYEMIELVEQRSVLGPFPWQCRIGLHSGPLFSAIVGSSRFQFDVMGDTVNTAARIEHAGATMVPTVSAEFLVALDGTAHEAQSLGEYELKGKGMMELFALTQLDKSQL